MWPTPRPSPEAAWIWTPTLVASARDIVTIGVQVLQIVFGDDAELDRAESLMYEWLDTRCPRPETLIGWCDSSVNGEMGCDGCELWNPAAGVRICYAGLLTERRTQRGP